MNTASFMEDAQPDKPIPGASSYARWPYVVNEAWIKELINQHHCKINAGNWEQWETLYKKHGQKLIGLCQMVEADKRWPDKVAAFIDRFERRNDNSEQLKLALAGQGIVITPDKLAEWKAFLTSGAGCKTLDQCKDAIQSMVDMAAKDGVTIRYVSNAAPYAKRWRR